MQMITLFFILFTLCIGVVWCDGLVPICERKSFSFNQSDNTNYTILHTVYVDGDLLSIRQSLVDPSNIVFQIISELNRTESNVFNHTKFGELPRNDLGTTESMMIASSSDAPETHPEITPIVVPPIQITPVSIPEITNALSNDALDKTELDRLNQYLSNDTNFFKTSGNFTIGNTTRHSLFHDHDFFKMGDITFEIMAFNVYDMNAFCRLLAAAVQHDEKRIGGAWKYVGDGTLYRFFTFKFSNIAKPYSFACRYTVEDTRLAMKCGETEYFASMEGDEKVITFSISNTINFIQLTKEQIQSSFIFEEGWSPVIDFRNIPSEEETTTTTTAATPISTKKSRKHKHQH